MIKIPRWRRGNMTREEFIEKRLAYLDSRQNQSDPAVQEERAYLLRHREACCHDFAESNGTYHSTRPQCRIACWNFSFTEDEMNILDAALDHWIAVGLQSALENSPDSVSIKADIVAASQLSAKLMKGLQREHGTEPRPLSDLRAGGSQDEAQPQVPHDEDAQETTEGEQG